LKPVSLGLDDDKDQVTSCIVEEAAVPVKVASTKGTARDQKMLRLGRDMMNGAGRVLKAELETRASQEFSWKKDTAQKAIRGAVKNGLLEETDGAYVSPAEERM